MQSPHTTKAGYIQGGSHSWQGVAMVTMDQEDYTNKANTLLQYTYTYKVLKKDCTNSLKKQTNNNS